MENGGKRGPREERNRPHLQPSSAASSTMSRRTRGARGRPAALARTREKKNRGIRYIPHLSDGYKERDDRTIFIGGGLPPGIRSKADIGNFFAESFGSVNHVHLQPNLKFGFVHFDTIEAAQDAVNTRKVHIMGAEIEIREGNKVQNPSIPEDSSHANDAEVFLSENRHLSDVDEDQEEDMSDGMEDGGEFAQVMEEATGMTTEQESKEGSVNLEAEEDKVWADSEAEEKMTAEEQEAWEAAEQEQAQQEGSEEEQAEQHGAENERENTAATPSGQKVPQRKQRLRLRGRGRGKGGKAAGRTENKSRQPVAKGTNTVVAGPLSDGFKQRDNRTIWIGQLSSKVRTKHDVANALQRDFGPVTHVHVQDDLAFGFVHFESAHSAAAALKARTVDVLGTRTEVRTAGSHAPAPDHSREKPDVNVRHHFFPSGRHTVERRVAGGIPSGYHAAGGRVAGGIPTGRHTMPRHATGAPRDYQAHQAHPPTSGEHIAGGYNADGYRGGGNNAVSPNVVGYASGHNVGGYQAGGHNSESYRIGGYPGSGYPAGGRAAAGLPASGHSNSASPHGYGAPRERSAPVLGSSRHAQPARPLGLERRQAGAPAAGAPPGRRLAAAAVTPPQTSARSSVPPKPSKAPHLARPAAEPTARPVAPTPKAALKRSAEVIGAAPGQWEQPKRLRAHR